MALSVAFVVYTQKIISACNYGAQEASSYYHVNSRNREVKFSDDDIAFKFARRFISTAAETPTKFQGDWKAPITDLAPSRLCEILR